MVRQRRSGIIAALLCLVAGSAAAQSVNSSEAASMSLEDLLSVQVVTTASKFPQSVREAPASITIVTAEEIRRHGHRTLADVLRTVRGLYTTYDRNYVYAGVRGFSRPGDYNTRVLLLLNGHRLNDALYDMAPIGTDFPLDVGIIDRVEVIRGPASSLYGTNALFAVINVVTRTGGQHSGLRLSAAGGSQESFNGTASYGRLFRSGSEALLAGSVFHSAGARRLFYPELATPDTTGEVFDLDGDRSRTFFGSFRTGALSVSGGLAGRRKHVPTAAFGTIVGNDQLVTVDNRYYLRAEYERRLGGGWTANTRASFDEYYYAGAYPYDYGDGATTLTLDRSTTRTLSGEIGVRRKFGQAHLVSTGTEILGHVKNDLVATDGAATILDVHNPATTWAVYAQDEFKPTRWLILSGGVRFDQSEDFGNRATPRLGVVVMPTQRTTVKFLHGRAFRAPNNYEREYYTLMRKAGRTLRPESIQSSELVWEEYLSSWLRTSVTGFHYQIDDVIEQRTEPTAGEIYFANSAGISGRGLEFEVEAKGRGISGSWNHSYVRTRDTGDNRVSNSPSHLSKFQVDFSVSSLEVAAGLQYLGSRDVLSGERLGPVLIPNLTVTMPVNRRLELSASVYNATSSAYSDPGAEEHLQHAIPQDGATALLRARLRF
jgi:outer membrane receptor for ferrienterochelin and colicins